MNLKYLPLLLSLLLPLKSLGQADCMTALTTCGNTSYTGLKSTGTGQIFEKQTGECFNNGNSAERNSVWIRVAIKKGGTLGFLIVPKDTSLDIDFDFAVYGPNSICGNLGDYIRFSYTEPRAADLTYNTTGLTESATNLCDTGGFDGNSYAKWLTVNDDEIYYILINRFSGESEFSVEWSGTAEFFDSPQFASPLIDLSTPSNSPIDLTQNTNVAVGTQQDLVVTYHTSQNDALININPISNPSSFVATPNQTIYVRVTNKMSGCFVTNNFKINNKTSPSFNQVGPICSGDNLILPPMSKEGVAGIWIPAPNNITRTEYTFTPTDDKNFNTVKMTVDVLPKPTASIGGGATVCMNATQPAVTFTGSGGLAPYTFTYNINMQPNQTTTSAAGGSIATINAPTTTAGTFNYNLVSVVDAKGCMQNLTGKAIITINPLPTASISGTKKACLNDTPPMITFTGANGTAPYTFTYKVGSAGNQTISSPSGSSTANISAPTAVTGTFDYNLVSVVDAKGCMQNQTGTATITINALPTATIGGTVTTCLNSTPPVITFTGLNGITPYTFTYNVGSAGNQTISSASGSSTATINAPTTTAGTFNYNLVSVVDASGCIQNQIGTATITINSSLSASIKGTATTCINATPPIITFTAASGTPPYTFTYNIGGAGNQTTTSAVGSSTATLNVPTTTAGTFTYNLVSVVDASGCIQNQIETATITINPLPAATITGNATACLDDTQPTIKFTGTNGLAPYIFTYNINGGTSQTINSASGNSIATLGVSTNIAGNFIYNLISVQDSNGCKQDQTGSAAILINKLPTATISGTKTVCKNDSEPVINFTGANGSSPYTITYNINGGPNQTITTIKGSDTVTLFVATDKSGTFDYNLVRIEDANNCKQNLTGTAKIIVNEFPTATISGTTTVCMNDNAPSISFTGSNGAPPYTFTYSINGGANQNISTTSTSSTTTIAVATNAAGSFEYSLVSVQDANCKQNQSEKVKINIQSLPIISGNLTTCVTKTSQLAAAGTAAPTNPWVSSNPAVATVSNTGLVTGIESGNAKITYTNSDGCKAETTVNILPNIVPVFTQRSIICPDDFIAPLPTTSKNNITGIWTPALNNKATTTYTFTPTDNSCSTPTTMTIEVATKNVLRLSLNQGVPFENDQEIRVTAEPAGNYLYQIDGGIFQESPIFKNLKGCAHIVNVKDICSNTSISSMVLNYPRFFTPNNDGNNDFWNISCNEYRANSIIYLYDRYGKLINEIKPTDIGWDGKLNNIDLPSDDYWFAFSYIVNGQTQLYKGHFSLIR